MKKQVDCGLQQERYQWLEVILGIEISFLDSLILHIESLLKIITLVSELHLSLPWYRFPLIDVIVSL